MGTWPFKATIDKPIRKIYAGSRTPLSTQSTEVPSADLDTQQPDFLPTVWGWMAYRDIFPGTQVHVTEYCYSMTELSEITEPGQPFEPNSPGFHHRRFTFVACARHNCTDENCEDYKDVARNLEK
jgi:hypothetical protein